MFSKRGQLSLFVIIAVVIVSSVLLFFAFKPGLSPLVKEPEPSGYIEKCMRDSASEALNVLSAQGGSLNPTGFVRFDDNKISYLCYTSDYYLGCMNQAPMLKYSVESEINEYIAPKIQECVSNLKQQYEKKGYQFDSGIMKLQTTIQPRKVIIDMEMPLTVTKEESNRYEKFEGVLLHPIYDQIMLSQEIVNSETEVGDFDQLSYMLYNAQTGIDKKSQGESTVYILEDKKSDKRFLFAIRSYVMPPGV